MQFEIKRRPKNTHAKNLPDHLPDLIKHILSNRGIDSESQLNLSATGLLNFQLLKGIEQAVAVLTDALLNKLYILVVGDFDADGATSTALSCMVLGEMGHQNVEYLVPDRFKMGYGLSKELVEFACLKKQPDIILTVDNGISSIEGIRYAQSLGIRVVVTDHHLPGNEMPDADAIVNPNQPGCNFPSKAACGCTVVFYVMAALKSELTRVGWFDTRPSPNMADYLDLVALATIADVVPLDHNNRIIVHQGLARIRRGKCQPGIQAILDVANKKAHRMTGTDLGFAVAPRLNAAGRMDDMSRGIECLMSPDLQQARLLAQELENLNQMRKDVESDMQAQALTWLSQFREADAPEALPWGLCLYDDHWHEGVIGILASRIKEKLNRPVIAFALSDNNVIKGSARSIKGFHMRDALDLVATRNPGLILKFGGHAMAAGLSIASTGYNRFIEAFDQVVREHLTEDDLNSVVWSDGDLPTDHLTINMARAIREAGPWGQNFPEPQFDGIFRIVQQRIVGQKHLKLTVTPDEGRTLFDAIAFNIDLDVWPNSSEYIRMSYQLDENEFNGLVRLQLLVNNLEPVL